MYAAWTAGAILARSPKRGPLGVCGWSSERGGTARNSSAGCSSPSAYIATRGLELEITDAGGGVYLVGPAQAQMGLELTKALRVARGGRGRPRGQGAARVPGALGHAGRCVRQAAADQALAARGVERRAPDPHVVGALRSTPASGRSSCRASSCWTPTPGTAGTESYSRLVAELGPLPEHPLAQTPTGGTHRWFKVPEDASLSNTAGTLAPGIDTRAAGKGSWCCHPRRAPWGAWRWVHRASMPALPAAWLERLLARRPGPEAERTRERDEWARLIAEPIPEGKRHTELAAYAGHVLAHGLSEAEALELLELVNAARAKPPLPGSELGRMVADLGERERRGRGAVAGAPVRAGGAMTGVPRRSPGRRAARPLGTAGSRLAGWGLGASQPRPRQG